MPDRCRRNVQRGVRALLARNVAIDDVGQLDAGKLLRRENTRNGAANGAEAKQRNAGGWLTGRQDLLRGIGHSLMDETRDC